MRSLRGLQSSGKLGFQEGSTYDNNNNRRTWQLIDLIGPGAYPVKISRLVCVIKDGILTRVFKKKFPCADLAPLGPKKPTDRHKEKSKT